jgi:HAD superfamily hydrolase (TIGR01549 family)
MTIKAVFFDLGETLVNEERLWGEWADVLELTRLTFFAALGSVIQRGEHHRKVFEQLGTTYQAALETRALKQIAPHQIQLEDFYVDAIPCLGRLRQAGYLIGLSGNQPAQTEKILHEFNLPVDFIASSASWGIEKPDPRFFQRIAQTAKLEPAQIAYVGDRLDNDVLPALEVGMFAVFLERGPWGAIHARRPEASLANARIRSLAELPNVLN